MKITFCSLFHFLQMMSCLKKFVAACLFLAMTVTSLPIQNHGEESLNVDNPDVTYENPPHNHPHLAKIVAEYLSIHKRSSDTDVLKFAMRSDNEGRINLGTVNRTLEFQSCNSMKALGGINGEKPHCPSEVFTGINDPPQKRSTCPWYYAIDHDPNRFPPTLLKAQPACTECIGSNGNYQCVGIARPMSVLKKSASKDSNGNSIWFQDEIRLTVGFTCAGRRFADNAATSAPAVATPDYQ